MKIEKKIAMKAYIKYYGCSLCKITRGITMKNFKILLVAVLSLGILLFVSPKSEVNAASKMTLSQLKAKFPHGKYWNHIGSRQNNPNGWTNTPCTHHGYKGSGCSYNGSCGCNATSSSIQAIQCAGYAYKLGLDAFGTSPKTWTKTSSRSYLYNNLKAGDLVRINNDGHSIFIIGVSGNTVTYTHCNVDGRCKIEWGRTMSKSALAAKLTYIRVAPSTFSKYAMNIHYDNDGGSGSITKQMVAYESTFTIPSASKFKKDGYTFDGFYLYRNEDKKYMCEDGNWYSEKEVSEKKLVKKVYQPGKTLSVSKAWTSKPAVQTKFIFVAKWKENPYSLQFHLNGAQGKMDGLTGVHGTDLILPSVTSLLEKHTSNGYHLYSKTKDKWLYNLDGTYNWLSEDDAGEHEKVLYSCNTVLEGIYPEKNEEFVAYVNWKPDVLTIKYYCFDHDTVLEDTHVSYGETSKLSKNTCVKPGYTFKGWQAYSTMLSQQLYSFNEEVIWSDDRAIKQGYTPVVFLDESEISYISPIANDVIIMQSVWVKDGTGEIVIADYHKDLLTKKITNLVTSSDGSLLQGVVDVVGGLLEMFIF